MTARSPQSPSRPPLPARNGRTQATVLARMLERLATWKVPATDGAPDDSPLHGVGDAPAPSTQAPLRAMGPLSLRQSTLSGSDLTYGLLDAWAVVADVLSFYQERITQEGYLLTATEDFSVQELVRTVGVTPRPAVSASVDLCFTVSDKPGAPESLPLPAGLPVQSVPSAPQEKPQLFETSAPLLTRPEWNAMTLWRPTPGIISPTVAPLRADAPALLLDGGSHGVQPGNTLLVRATTAEGKEWLGLPRVTRTGSAHQRGCLAWDAKLDEKLGSKPLSGIQAWTCRAPEALLGHDAKAWDQLSLDDQLKNGGTPVGGTQSLDVARNAWQSLGAQFPGKVYCLLVDERGLFAGVEGQGLMTSPQDGGATWTSVKALARMDVLCLGYDAQQRLVAGTSRHGVLRSTDGLAWETLRGKTQDQRLPSTPVRCVAGFLEKDGSKTKAFLLAGTDEGLFRWDEQAGTWSPANNGLPLADTSSKDGKNGLTPVSVVSIVEDEGNQRFVLGTSQGVFTGPDPSAPAWKAADPAGAGKAVKTLLRDDKGLLFVALEDGGLYRTKDAKSLTYVPVSPKTPSGQARVNVLLPLASGPGGPAGLLALLTEGVFLTRDGGTHWTPLSAPASLEVWAAAELGPGQVLAFTPVVGVKETQWPGWELKQVAPQDSKPAPPLRLDLARSVPRLGEGQRLVLEQEADDGTAHRALFTVKGAVTEQVKAFGERQLVTRLQLEPEDPKEDLSGFDRKSARVRSCIAPLPLLGSQIRTPGLLKPDTDLHALLAQDDLFSALVQGSTPEQGSTPVLDAGPVGLSAPVSLRVAGAVTDPVGRTVLVVGQRKRVWVAEQLAADEGSSQSLSPGQVLDVMGWPAKTDEQRAPRWKLRTEHGVVVEVTATTDQLLLLPAAPDSETVALRRRVILTEPLSGSMLLTLDEPLEEMFDPDTVAVRGNVVEATHGTTIQEVLGSGDARRTQQQFRLKRSPLVWLDAPQGPEPQVEVYVNDQRWRRVEDWSGQKPDSAVYQLREDLDGTVRVCFGDGVRGARLPSGAENVRAVYRTGGGPDGNVGVGRLILLRQRLQGLRAVDNPLPASGGVAAQPSAELRTQAPLQLQTLQRIVSLRDFEDYVRTLPGVARVRSRQLWNGHAPVLSLTVATTEEDTGHRMSPKLEQTIRQEVESFRPAHHVLQVDSFVPRPFHLEATLTVDPTFDAKQVQDAAVKVLTDAFRFEQRELAQPVATSDLLRLLTGVRGVLNARVTALRYGDTAADTGPVPPLLTAADSSWDAASGKVLPAEMLLLEASGPVLTVEKGP